MGHGLMPLIGLNSLIRAGAPVLTGPQSPGMGLRSGALPKLLDALRHAFTIFQGAGGDAFKVGLHGIDRSFRRIGRFCAASPMGGLEVWVGGPLQDGHRSGVRNMRSDYAHKPLDTSKLSVPAHRIMKLYVVN